MGSLTSRRIVFICARAGVIRSNAWYSAHACTNRYLVRINDINNRSVLQTRTGLHGITSSGKKREASPTSLVLSITLKRFIVENVCGQAICGQRQQMRSRAKQTHNARHDARTRLQQQSANPQRVLLGHQGHSQWRSQQPRTRPRQQTLSGHRSRRAFQQATQIPRQQAERNRRRFETQVDRNTQQCAQPPISIYDDLRPKTEGATDLPTAQDLRTQHGPTTSSTRSISISPTSKSRRSITA